MLGMKRIFALLGLAIGLIAAALMLSASARGSLYILGILAGLGLLYGSYLIFRGKTSLLFGWAKKRTGAMINLVLGVATLLIPGGVGGTASILAIVSGVLGFVAATCREVAPDQPSALRSSWTVEDIESRTLFRWSASSYSLSVA